MLDLAVVLWFLRFRQTSIKLSAVARRMGARFGGAPFCYSRAWPLRGEISLGVTAMTTKDAQQIAHGMLW
jgi:hypothetical protein